MLEDQNATKGETAAEEGGTEKGTTKPADGVVPADKVEGDNK